MMKIDVKSITRKVEVDNRIPLHYYYRIADNLIRQANVYRDENNIVDLYIMLVRYSSLVSETIPLHRDYQVLHPKEKSTYRKKLFQVLDELEALKPKFQQRVNELNRVNAGQQFVEVDSQERPGITSGTASQDWSSAGRNSNMIMDKQPASMASTSVWNYKNNQYQMSSSNPVQMDKQFQKLAISLPVPKKETLSRHSFLGPTALQSQWSGPTGLQSQWSGPTEMKVHYPSGIDVSKEENTCLPQAPLAIKDGNQVASVSGATMESVLSLDDGRWSREECLANEFREDPFQFVSVKQPYPPPVLAEVRQSPIPPSQVADPRPGPAKLSQQSPSSYQHLHVPVNMMEEFLRLARQNTAKNLETCAILAGSLKNRTFHITNLIIPKQESTSDSCQTLNEEEIFEVQDKLSLFPLGWIHTHPSQTCFMSSVDLHTHYSYQIMLPEAIAIVMAPTDTSSPHGIFHLSDPSGVNVIRNCQERGFHPHEEPVDGSPIYEHCSHVFMNSKLKFDIIDLR